MAKHLFIFSCPCCDKEIELDTRSGKSRAMVPGEGKGQDFDILVKQQDQASQRLKSIFDQAQEDNDSQSDRFDQLLSDATEKSKNDTSRPRNPFDLE